jgi:5-methylcytosine-specific restriction endonuclease McrA
MPEIRTYADRREYIKQAVTKRRKAVRSMLLEYKGGRCTLCGYNTCANALELHHRIKSEKDFGLSAHGLTRAWLKVKAEADKCELVCANCHREVHSGIVQPPWVTKE